MISLGGVGGGCGRFDYSPQAPKNSQISQRYAHKKYEAIALKILIFTRNIPNIKFSNTLQPLQFRYKT